MSDLALACERKSSLKAEINVLESFIRMNCKKEQVAHIQSIMAEIRQISKSDSPNYKNEIVAIADMIDERFHGNFITEQHCSDIANMLRKLAGSKFLCTCPHLDNIGGCCKTSGHKKCRCVIGGKYE